MSLETLISIKVWYLYLVQPSRYDLGIEEVCVKASLNTLFDNKMGMFVKHFHDHPRDSRYIKRTKTKYVTFDLSL